MLAQAPAGGGSTPAPATAAPAPPTGQVPDPGQPGRGGPGRGRGNQPIVLNADDVQAFPEPPADIAAPRAGVARGALEMIEYDSKTVGTRRKMQVYTPPGYSKSKTYPVLYLLHGIGGDETEWQRFAHPVLLDNIIATARQPMILLCQWPGAGARRAGGNPRRMPARSPPSHATCGTTGPASGPLLGVVSARESRVAGLRWWRQTLNFGLAHLDRFEAGAFSGGAEHKAVRKWCPTGNRTRPSKLSSVLWEQDGLLLTARSFTDIKERTSRYL